MLKIGHFLSLPGGMKASEFVVGAEGANSPPK
jgi:hypothetical protein